MRAAFRDHAEAAAKGWREVGLGRSFRSTAAVLAAVDAVFAGPAARDGVAFADTRGSVTNPTARATPAASSCGRWSCRRKPRRRPPGHRPWRGAPADSPRDRLARHIADSIHGWIAGGERLEARGRAIRPGDILVLVRRRKGFVEALVRALKARGVPVAGADRMMLTEQLAVMDLVALGAFLLLPEDDLTLATVLKGPLIGLDEDALFHLAHGRGDERLWRTLGRRRSACEAFERAHGALAALLARADYAPPYELFAEVLGARGGRRKLVARLGPDANDPIDEFLALALAYERGGPPSLQGFLHWLAAGDVEVKRDLERGRDEVRVMTVHGAKGLEAPIVILPDTTGLPPAGGAQVLWHDADAGNVDGAGALLWPGRGAFDDARCRAARAVMRKRDLEEYRRLLYVAMTRAEDRLYIGGWQGRNEIPEGCWYRLVEDAMAREAEPFEFDAWPGRAFRIAGPQTRAPVTGTASPDALGAPRPLPPFAGEAPPPEPAPPRPLAPSRAPAQGAAAEPAMISPLAAGDERFLRGRLIHRLLQALPEVAPGDRADACRRLLGRAAPALAGEAREAIAAEVLGVIEDTRFAALFGPGSRAEAPLIGIAGAGVVAGQVDRLVVGDDRVMVVDYKTNRPPPDDEAGVAPAYLAQMAAYRAVLSQIYPEKSITCALLWTDGPRLMQLGDAALARHAP